MAVLTDGLRGLLPPRRASGGADAASALVPGGGGALGSGQVLQRLAQVRQAHLMLRAGAMALAGGALLWAALAGAGALIAPRPAEMAAAAATPAAQAWSEVIRPMPIYDLGGTGFAKLSRAYRARRHAPDGTREDTMSFGSPGDGKPYLRIALARRGDGPTGRDVPSLADALARVAGTAGATVTELRPLPPIETRFGTLDRVDLLLWRGGAAMPCSGFRAMPSGGTVLTFAGLACRGADRSLADNAVACVVDRIDLLSAGDDHALRALFVAAERRPGTAACGEGVLASNAGPTSAPGPFAAFRRRAAWLEAGPGAPPLRGALDSADGDR